MTNTDMNCDVAVVAILHGDDCRLASNLDRDTALTLMAVASEDPTCWDDIVACWPRYHTPVVAEFADGLPFEIVDRRTALRNVKNADAWVVIDLEVKRIVTGGDFQSVGRDQAYSMYEHGNENDQHALSIHLPPWWELHESASANVIERPRAQPIAVPFVNREILYGDALLEGLADGILTMANAEPELSFDGKDGQQRLHQMTVEVHRDWLMTPRVDLSGLMPRQMLHGAHDWIGRLEGSQRLRFQDGASIVATPDDVTNFDTAPMGSAELIIYFDLCRELICSGWSWCAQQGFFAGERQTTAENTVPNPTAVQKKALVELLKSVKASWLSSSFEGGSPPSFIIECSRRRVPRGTDVPIVGMSERESPEHFSDCDCPICNMMADGIFGPSFSFLDGHHLDLDDEFAFSMHERREDWEREQREFEFMSDSYDRAAAERDTGETARRDSIAIGDQFMSAWSNTISDEPIPGDSTGTLKLAFLMAELVAELQSTDANSDQVQELNTRFTEFRRGVATDEKKTAVRLVAYLDALADEHPRLVPRVADFQSRIDERLRSSSMS